MAQQDGLTEIAADVRRLAEETDFSGVVRIEQGAVVADEFARGFANRADEISNRLDTRFAVASGMKGLTALTIMSLAVSGELSLDSKAKELLGDVLPLIDDRVTIPHMLSHTSGIGDFLDEEALEDEDDYILDVSAHTLTQPSDYLSFISYPQVFPPGEKFAYNNGAYVMLSLIIERIAGSFHDTVAERVLGPAGIDDGGFFRTDALPANTALGYLKDGRTNVFHLPVIAAGDGGIYLTLDDVSAFWQAFLSGAIVPPEVVEQMTSPVHMEDNGRGYGFGFWLEDNGESVRLIGHDAGVSFTTLVQRATDRRYTIISNSSTGVWPLARHLDQALV